MIKYTLKNNSGKARLGLINLNGHVIETPCFMPVGTAATVKTMTASEVSNFGYKIILSSELDGFRYRFYY
jgi:queuine tRNA-ribosyltransferase